MEFGKKSLTIRAAEAVKKLESSEVLLKIRREISARVGEVDAEQIAKVREQDRAIEQGDLEALQAAKNAHAALRDEELVLRKQDSDLHQALKLVHGREAVAAIQQHRKTLDATLKQAMHAQAAIEECKKTISKIVAVRKFAAEINEKILFNPETIASLAGAIFPDGNEQKQLMIDLGIVDSRRAQRSGQSF